MGRRIIPYIAAIALLLSGCGDLTQQLEEKIIESQGLTEHTLTVAASSGGSVTTPSTYTEKVFEGISFNIVATPDTGYDFSGWNQVDGDGTVSFTHATEASTTATLTGGDATITASFSREQYTLTVSAGSNGSVTPTEAQTVEYGVPQAITATADPGYTFTQWSQPGGTGTAAFDNPNQASTNVIVTGGDVMIQANFTDTPRTVDITAGEGGIITTPSQPSIDSTDNAWFSLEAVANEGYHFFGWTATGTGTVTFTDASKAATTAKVSGGDATISANFALTEYNLTINAGTGGNVTPSGVQQLTQEDSLEITATPGGNYDFVHWEKIIRSGEFGTVDFADDTDKYDSNPTITLSGGDATIEAIFELKERNVTVTAGENGSILEPANNPYTARDGESFSLIAVPDEGYHFTGWDTTGSTGTVTIDDNDVPNTLAFVTGGNATITASFAINTYTLTLAVSDPAEGEVENIPTSTVTVTHGVPLTIVASRPFNRGMYFSGWTATGMGTATFDDVSAADTTVTVTGDDVTIQANYDVISAVISYVESYDVSSYFESINDIVVTGDYAYIGGKKYYPERAQMVRIDISDPTNPSFSNGWYSSNNDTEAAVRDLHVVGTTVNCAVTGADGGFYTIDTTQTITFNPVRDWSGGSLMKVGGEGFAVGYRDSFDETSFNHVIKTSASSDWTGLNWIQTFLYTDEYSPLFIVGNNVGSFELHGISYGGSSFYESIDPLKGSSNLFQDLIQKDGYLYAAKGTGGFETIDISGTALTVAATAGASPNSGKPEYVEFGSTRNYLVVLGQDTGTPTRGRLCVFDIHENNGSNEDPLLINVSSTPTVTIENSAYQPPQALATSGDYIYTIEGHHLVIYKLTTNTD